MLMRILFASRRYQKKGGNKKGVACLYIYSHDPRRFERLPFFIFYSKIKDVPLRKLLIFIISETKRLFSLPNVLLEFSNALI